MDLTRKMLPDELWVQVLKHGPGSVPSLLLVSKSMNTVAQAALQLYGPAFTADVLRDTQGVSAALLTAVKYGFGEVVQVILEKLSDCLCSHGVRVVVPRALHVACESGFADAARMLLTQMREHVDSWEIERAMCIAAEHGFIDTVRAILDLWSCPMHSATRPLTKAADGGHLEVLRVILVAVPCADIESAMTTAARKGDIQTVRAILESSRRRNKRILMPVARVAREAGFTEIAELIKERAE